MSFSFQSFYQHLGRWTGRGAPPYDELLEEKERLRKIALFWRYPDGDYVPQKKRQRVLLNIQAVSKQIATHPDNPQNQG